MLIPNRSFQIVSWTISKSVLFSCLLLNFTLWLLHQSLPDFTTSYGVDTTLHQASYFLPRRFLFTSEVRTSPPLRHLPSCRRTAKQCFCATAALSNFTSLLTCTILYTPTMNPIKWAFVSHFVP